jgi:hypothetical protein
MIQAGRRHFTYRHSTSRTLVLPSNCHRATNRRAGCEACEAMESASAWR